jgi:hypothetical protein
MNEQLFSLYSWPRAILHFDGDAFFTSCEEAIHPELKDKLSISSGTKTILAIMLRLALNADSQVSVVTVWAVYLFALLHFIFRILNLPINQIGQFRLGHGSYA